MIRRGNWKYVHHVGFPERLFDLGTNPDERHDLAGDPAYIDQLELCRQELRTICDPFAVDSQVRADQQRRLEEFGGVEEVLKTPLMTHSPVGSP
jgi:choline-sulfatase